MKLPFVVAAGALLAACTTPHAATAPSNTTITLDEAAGAHPGQIALVSQHSFAETKSRLRSSLESRGLTVFAVVEHSEGARRAGLELAPSTLFIFGNPRAGTPLMQADPRMGLELPLKMLVHETEAGVVVVYPSIVEVAARYGVGPDDAPIARIAETLGDISADAALNPVMVEARR